jgi:oligosaccharide reducing-end xylanase
MRNLLLRSSVLGLTALLMMGCSQQGSLPNTIDTSGNTLTQQGTALLHKEAETMTNGGGCTGIQATQVVYYCNNDTTFNTYTFAQAGRYSITLKGASSNASAASINVLVGGASVGLATFSGTAYTNQTIVFDTTAGAKEIRLTETTDNGSNDTLVDAYDLAFEGVTPPPPPAPVPPSIGAAASGNYRNLFKEWNPAITDTQITDKLNSYWDSLFNNTDDNKRVYYPAGSNTNGPMAYIYDTGNRDVRSEGMSYGMMIAVQMNKPNEFKALWNYAKTYMQHKTTARAGYFAWQVGTAGNIMDPNPASDGEEYFATALLLAGNRWGNGTGIYNYAAEGNAILNTMLHKEDMNGGVVDSIYNMFNKAPDKQMVVFVPYATSASFTDPSYHLPAFYELWSRWATGYNGGQVADRAFWASAAAKSRAFFVSSTNSTTALNPDYAEFSGAPKVEGGHESFRFDAWRTAVNWSVDYAWWAKDNNQKALSDKLQTFFTTAGVTSYFNQYTLTGTSLSADRSPGLIASNGAASLAATDSRAWKFVEEQWKLNPPVGQYRYYDGLVSFLGLLHSSGSFKIYGSVTGGGGGNVAPSVSITSPVSGTTLPAGTTSVAFNANATDSDGTISSVKFYNGATLVATDTTAPYSATVTGLTAGSYTLKATATDNSGATTDATSSITVASVGGNVAPTVSITSPVSGSTLPAGTTSVTVNATAADSDGTVSSVKFYNGATLVATDTTAPYSATLTGLSAGNYTFKATATDNSGATTDSLSSVTIANSTGGGTGPYGQLEAETFSSQSGATTSSADGGTVVNLAGSSSYIVFNGLNFGTAGASSINFRASTTTSGDNLQVRVGSATASPVCTVYPDSNGAWHLKSNSCYPKITGTQNIYITSTGPASINWLTFAP